MAGFGVGLFTQPLCPMRATPPEATNGLEGQEQVAERGSLDRHAVAAQQQPSFGEQSRMLPVTPSDWSGRRRDFDEIDQAWRLAKSKEICDHMRSLPKLTSATDEEILGYTEDGLLDP